MRPDPGTSLCTPLLLGRLGGLLHCHRISFLCAFTIYLCAHVLATTVYPSLYMPYESDCTGSPVVNNTGGCVSSATIAVLRRPRLPSAPESIRGLVIRAHAAAAAAFPVRYHRSTTARTSRREWPKQSVSEGYQPLAHSPSSSTNRSAAQASCCGGGGRCAVVAGISKTVHPSPPVVPYTWYRYHEEPAPDPHAGQLLTGQDAQLQFQCVPTVDGSLDQRLACPALWRPPYMTM